MGSGSQGSMDQGLDGPGGSMGQSSGAGKLRSEQLRAVPARRSTTGVDYEIGSGSGSDYGSAGAGTSMDQTGSMGQETSDWGTGGQGGSDWDTAGSGAGMTRWTAAGSMGGGGSPWAAAARWAAAQDDGLRAAARPATAIWRRRTTGPAARAASGTQGGSNI